MADEWIILEESGEPRNPLAHILSTKHVEVNPAPIKQGDALNKIEFYLNGEQRVVSNPDPEMLLVDYLRNVEGLTGTKKSCGEGGCGACLVLLSKPSQDPPVPVNSCLRLLCSVNGQYVTTIEGVGSSKKGFHPVQSKLAECDGSQCGFCSPGMVMSMVGLLESNAEPSPTDVETQFDGNLCRCTGYRPILDAMQSFAKSSKESGCCKDKAKGSCTEQEKAACNGGKGCDGKAKSSGGCCGAEIEDLCGSVARMNANSTGVRARVQRRLGGGEVSWYAPTSLPDLLGLMGSFSSTPYRLVASNTATQGVEKYFNGKAYGAPVQTPPVFIDIQNVPELNSVSISDFGINFGGCNSITAMIDTLEANTAKSATFAPVSAHLRKIASHPVRNAGTIAGNIMLAHKYPNFASDLVLLMTAVSAQMFVASSSDPTLKQYSVPDFMALDMTNKLLVAVCVPVSNMTFRSFKIMLRHQNSHAIVNAAFGAVLDSNYVVQDAVVCYGGIQRTGVVRAALTEALMKGRNITQQDTLSAVLSQVRSEVVADPSFGRTQYRQNLVTSLMYKFILSLQPTVPVPLQSAAQDFVRPVSSGTWNLAGAEDPSEFPVSKPIPKVSGLVQTSGEALYTDDNPATTQHMFGAFVLTKKANATISAVDTTAALAANGVIGYIDAAKVASANFDVSFMDEPLFVTDQSLHVGDRIGLILADTQAHADAAANLVKVTYTNEQDLILDLDAAIAAKSFYVDPSRQSTLTKGDAATALANADVVVTGTARCGHQYHFHMETQTADATVANSKVLVRSATQAPRLLQQAIAALMKRQDSEVEVVMDRAGGGYGGKITRCFPTAIAAAVASALFEAPVRIVLNLNSNITMLGSRIPHRLDYTVGVLKDGTITAVTGTAYNLQGARKDLGMWDPLPSMLGIDNAYNVANWNIQGYACKSNTPGNTACRGPGFLPGAYLIENVIEHVADALGMTPDQIRSKNMYKKNDVTPLNQTLAYCTQQDTYNLAKQTAGFDNLQQAVNTFNSQNKYVKQGVAVVPTKYYMPASFGYAAIVTINPDGSLLIQHSGCECGQGIDTKVSQVASLVLSVDMSKITVAGVTSIISTNVTGGSITSEGNCASVRLACEQLLSNSATVRAELRGKLGREPTFMEWVTQAFAENVVLQASGTYNGQGEPGLPGPSPYGPNQYVSYGAAVVHVQLDVLTGEVQVLRSDVVFDCGTSLNPAIDCGQVQGAFTMGLGYMLTEEFVWDQDGSVTGYPGTNISNGTWEYKPVSTTDIPIEFNITMLPNAPNPMGVLSSKASGEPAILASIGVLCALQRAVNSFTSTPHSTLCPRNRNYKPNPANSVSKSAELVKAANPGQRRVHMRDDRVQLNAPATVEVLQLACGVDYTTFTLQA